VVAYEELLREPVEGVGGVIASTGWGHEARSRSLEKVARTPSRTTRGLGEWRDSKNDWRGVLSNEEADRVLGVVEEFGMSFYSGTLEPDVDAMRCFFGLRGEKR
jgi:hypothetical protein